MTTARQKAIREKRRQGIRPYCRKRMLTPRAITKAHQAVDAGPAELNENFLHPLPRAIQQTRRRGAPRGNTNRLVSGKYTGDVLAFRARIRAHIREARVLVEEARRLIGRLPVRTVVAVI